MEAKKGQGLAKVAYWEKEALECSEKGNNQIVQPPKRYSK